MARFFPMKYVHGSFVVSRHRMAREKGVDVFGFQHDDAEAGNNAAEQFFERCRRAGILTP